MLKDYIDSYIQKADLYLEPLNWRKCDKNLLFNGYVEAEQNGNQSLMDAYLSALMMRYWHLINSNYAKGKGVYDKYECYNWLVTAVVITLKRKPWLDTKSKLYKDVNGADKSVNCIMVSKRQGWYQWSNCEKRAKYFTKMNSLDSLLEEAGDAILPSENYTESNTPLMLDIKDMIKDEFKHKNYLSSFVIDGIINADCFDVTVKGNDVYTQFSRKKLSKHVRNLTDDYLDNFAKLYHINKDEVYNARQCCMELTRSKTYKLLDATIVRLAESHIV